MGIIDYHSPLNILISVKGHPYERDAFAAVFESFEGIRHTFVEQPASQAFMNPEAAAPYDAIVFYDMPGIDFSTQPPGFVAPPEDLKKGFMDLLSEGKGMVFLHHAIAGWPLWPEYGTRADLGRTDSCLSPVSPGSGSAVSQRHVFGASAAAAVRVSAEGDVRGRERIAICRWREEEG